MVRSRSVLLAALVVTTLVVTAAVCLAGWQLVNRERDNDLQRAQDRDAAIAKSIASGIGERLADAGDRLSTAAANPTLPLPAIDGAAVITSQSDGTVIKAAGLPFVPAVPEDPTLDAVFDEAEALEFARSDLEAAAVRYRDLARDRNEGVRAGALLRLARLAEKREDLNTALRTYQELERLGDVRVAQRPARFVALFQQRGIARARGDTERERLLTAELTAGLRAADWPMTRLAAGHYLEQLGVKDLPDAWWLADAVERVWRTDGSPLPRRGQRVMTDGRPVLVLWRSSGSVTAMMAAFLDEFLPPAPPEAAWHLRNPAGFRIAGDRNPPGGAAAPHVIGDPDHPWMLQVGSLAPANSGGQWTLIAMMTAMLVFLWVGMYFIARAIRRESAVSRLQSDFVAAVSHEFRSPLTTIRQMAEMLEMGRVTSDDRRQAYYSVLTGEAARLQRLVETLLNFGRMEAGAAHYRLEEVDLTGLVRRVVQEMEPGAAESGRQIETSGPETGVLVRADVNALSLAVRNLIDNARKYSPNQATVRVEVSQGDGRALIRVIDRGIGIPRAEQQTIFEKFVRGRSAIDSNVAGTGVGLAMVRQIVRAHDGDVDVESEVGQGSTFTLAMPLVNSQIPNPKSQEVAAAG